MILQGVRFLTFLSIFMGLHHAVLVTACDYTTSAQAVYQSLTTQWLQVFELFVMSLVCIIYLLHVGPTVCVCSGNNFFGADGIPN